MNKKLTLTIEETVIKNAKKYARKSGRSLSDIIENYLKSISKKEEPLSKNKSTPLVSSLRGSFRISEDVNYKEELSKTLSEKYHK